MNKRVRLNIDISEDMQNDLTEYLPIHSRTRLVTTLLNELINALKDMSERDRAAFVDGLLRLRDTPIRDLADRKGYM